MLDGESYGRYICSGQGFILFETYNERHNLEGKLQGCLPTIGDTMMVANAGE